MNIESRINMSEDECFNIQAVKFDDHSHKNSTCVDNIFTITDILQNQL